MGLPMLTLDGLEVHLPGFALRADLAVPAGSRVAVIGPSGSGKSTLLAAIAGFVKPGRGQVLWCGRDLTGLPPQDRPVAIVFQENNAFPHMSAAANVALGIRPSGRLSREEAARVEAALERVGLGGLGGRKPAALSGGQQSRVALARLLLQSRPVILLDEPFSALGPALRAEMLDLVGEIVDAAGATLLMVTHHPADAARMTPLTIMVDGGTAAPPADTASLLADPPPALRSYLG